MERPARWASSTSNGTLSSQKALHWLGGCHLLRLLCCCVFVSRLLVITQARVEYGKIFGFLRPISNEAFGIVGMHRYGTKNHKDRVGYGMPTHLFFVILEPTCDNDLSSSNIQATNVTKQHLTHSLFLPHSLSRRHSFWFLIISSPLTS